MWVNHKCLQLCALRLPPQMYDWQPCYKGNVSQVQHLECEVSERQMTCANSFCAPNAPLSVFSPLNLTSNSQTVFGISNKINLPIICWQGSIWNPIWEALAICISGPCLFHDCARLTAIPSLLHKNLSESLCSVNNFAVWSWRKLVLNLRISKGSYWSSWMLIVGKLAMHTSM